MEMKCRTCGEDDPSLIATTYDKRYDRYRSRGYCRKCHSDNMVGERRESPEKARRAKDSNLRSTYGISIEDFDQMLEDQVGGCAICGRGSKKWYVDHDHACCPGKKSCGDCVRGILCNACNVALGCFGDDESVMAEAISYILRHRQVATG